ncbi:hypothetical protein [Pseudoalteromonas umbrosa]|nr:hypothetical protein [Pseudoalteromonas sp. B95]MDK1290089.1 hypothetical protein [Pseudoalteromonas sp. B95]
MRFSNVLLCNAVGEPCTYLEYDSAVQDRQIFGGLSVLVGVLIPIHD